MGMPLSRNLLCFRDFSEACNVGRNGLNICQFRMKAKKLKTLPSLWFSFVMILIEPNLIYEVESCRYYAACDTVMKTITVSWLVSWFLRLPFWYLSTTQSGFSLWYHNDSWLAGIASWIMTLLQSWRSGKKKQSTWEQDMNTYEKNRDWKDQYFYNISQTFSFALNIFICEKN